MLNYRQRDFLDSMRAAFVAIGLPEDDPRIEAAARAFYQSHEEQCCTCVDWENPAGDTEGGKG